MVSGEVILLTGAVVVADVIALREYLRMEEKLARVKAESALQPKLSGFAAEVNAPLATPQPMQIAMTSDEKDRVELEKEAAKLKEKMQVKAAEHRRAMGTVSDKVNSVLEYVSSVRAKVTGENTTIQS